jgi:tRNA(Phe) wybutosine-synthesizing methylase Tyw3
MNNSDNDIDEEIITNNNNDEETITPTGTGKGYGAWLISCHGKITYLDLQQALNQHCHKFQNTDSSTPLIFKHEPLLLHVATSNLQRAHQLLTLAINLGFRESGTISSPKRITVAIRSMSLSLTVPLASKGTLRPNDEYLVELVKEANHRMTLNEAKLKALFESVKSTLFTIPSIHITNDNAASTTSSGDNTPTFQTHFQQLPDLNLWRHAAVVIPSPNHSETINNNDHSNNNVDIITFGGYGLGPNNNITKNPNRKCSRTNKVYRLRRTNGIWNSKWDEIIHSVDSQDHFNDVNHQPLHSLWNVQRTHFTEREGHSACILRLECNSLPSIQKHEKIAAIFGGRSSPSKANNDLFFFPCDSNPASFYKPVDVRGEHPTARWGHSLTPLLIPSKDGRLPLVAIAGGRNESSVVSSVHILYQVIPENNDMNHFLWETLNASIPRFYHSAVSITPDQIFIFGGLESPLSLLGLDSSLSESGLQNTRKLPTFVLGLKTGDNSCDFLLDNGDSPTCLVNKYGAGACSLLHLDKNSNVPDSNVFVCLGGLSNES